MRSMACDEPSRRDTSKRYVTIDDAAAESGVTERTIRRWIEKKRVHVIRDKTRHIRVDLDDILAHARLNSDSPLRFQVLQLQRQVEEIDHSLTDLTELVSEIRAWQRQQILAAELTQAVGGAPSQHITLQQGLAQLLATLRRSSPQPLERSERLARRGLPGGTLRLVEFAASHQIKVHDLKKLHYAGKIHLSIYERENPAERNKQEWWIAPDQCREIIAYYDELALSYQKCTLCPHQQNEVEEQKVVVHTQNTQ